MGADNHPDTNIWRWVLMALAILCGLVGITGLGLVIGLESSKFEKIYWGIWFSLSALMCFLYAWKASTGRLWPHSWISFTAIAFIGQGIGMLSSRAWFDYLRRTYGVLTPQMNVNSLRGILPPTPPFDPYFAAWARAYLLEAPQLATSIVAIVLGFLMLALSHMWYFAVNQSALGSSTWGALKLVLATLVGSWFWALGYPMFAPNSWFYEEIQEQPRIANAIVRISTAVIVSTVWTPICGSILLPCILMMCAIVGNIVMTIFAVGNFNFNPNRTWIGYNRVAAGLAISNLTTIRLFWVIGDVILAAVLVYLCLLWYYGKRQSKETYSTRVVTQKETATAYQAWLNGETQTTRV